MFAIRERRNRLSLSASVAAVVVIAGVTDAAIRAVGWNQPPGEIWPDFAPRGRAIGLIWVGLFGGMGAAHWLVARSARSGAARSADAIAVLIAACLSYPFYTHFIHGHATELAGNVVTFVLATGIAIRTRHHSRLGAVLIGVVAAWIVFATVLVLALIRLNGWGTT
jgi:tryptophan-rich sensory protein